MARLSVEHYRANANMTPEHVRKTGRFRDIFRSRPGSSSNLTEPDDRSPQAKSSLSSPTSAALPAIRPGFNQVGLLPSEQEPLMDVKQALKKISGSRVAEMLEKEFEELKGMSVRRNIDHGLDAAVVSPVDEIARGYRQTENTKQANHIAGAFKDALLKSKEEEAGRFAAAATGMRHLASHEVPSVPPTATSRPMSNGEDDAPGFNEEGRTHAAPFHTKNVPPGTGALQSHDAIEMRRAEATQHEGDVNYAVEEVDKDEKSRCTEYVQQSAFDTTHSPGQMAAKNTLSCPNSGTFYDERSDSLHTDEKDELHEITSSPAPRVIDNEEYLSRKFGDLAAFSDADRTMKLNHSLDATVTDAMTDSIVLTLRVKFSKTTGQPKPAVLPVGTGPAKLFLGPKAVGTFVITDRVLVFVLQLIVVVAYIWLALRILINGPSSMFLHMFVVTSILVAYTAAMRQYGHFVSTQDMLVGPLNLVKCVVLEKFGQGALTITRGLLDRLMEVLYNAAEDINMEVTKD